VCQPRRSDAAATARQLPESQVTPWIWKPNASFDLVIPPRQADSFDDAEAHCVRLGGHLVTVGDEERNERLRTLLREGGHENLLLGGRNDIVGELGEWYWVGNHEELRYSNWAWGQPDGGGWDTQEKCIEMWEDGQWNDFGCAPRHFACDLPPGAVVQATSFPCSAIKVETRSQLAGAQGDDEDAAASTEAQCRYVLPPVAAMRSQADGAAACKALGPYGQLAELHDMAQEALLKRAWRESAAASHPSLWLGLVLRDGTWRWAASGRDLNGQEARWGSGQPDGDGACVEVWPDGSWNDRECDFAQMYACEVPLRWQSPPSTPSPLLPPSPSPPPPPPFPPASPFVTAAVPSPLAVSPAPPVGAHTPEPLASRTPPANSEQLLQASSQSPPSPQPPAPQETRTSALATPPAAEQPTAARLTAAAPPPAQAHLSAGDATAQPEQGNDDLLAPLLIGMVFGVIAGLISLGYVPVGQPRIRSVEEPEDPLGGHELPRPRWSTRRGTQARQLPSGDEHSDDHADDHAGNHEHGRKTVLQVLQDRAADTPASSPDRLGSAACATPQGCAHDPTLVSGALNTSQPSTSNSTPAADRESTCALLP